MGKRLSTAMEEIKGQSNPFLQSMKGTREGARKEEEEGMKWEGQREREEKEEQRRKRERKRERETDPL